MRAGMAAAGVGGAIAAAIVWSEVVHRRARGRRLGSRPGTGGTGTAVVVLGFRDRGPTANAVNRARVRAGLRSRPEDGPSVLVLSGGAKGGTVSEAALMARYARSRGAEEPIVLEEGSRTTWENVQGVVPFIEHADRIVFASGALHAEKARAYLWRLRPDMAERLVAGGDHRPGELLLLRPAMAVVGLRDLRRLRSGDAPGGTTP